MITDYEAMSESLTTHWTEARCREVLDQLLAEEKGRCCYLGCVSGDYTVTISFRAEHKEKCFKSYEDAQAWLDQQWKEYVEGMKP